MSSVFILNKNTIYKKCPLCKKIKEKKCFYKDKHKNYGISTYCKSCDHIREMEKERSKNRQVGTKPRYKNEEDKIVRQRITRRKYRNKRLKNDIDFKLKERLRYKVWRTTRKYKNNKFSELLGCNISYFKKHIESNFNLNMSWDNYGEYWEIDHIIPISIFNLKKESEQKKCWNYRNLRPLEKNKNREKYNKINMNIIHKNKIRYLLPMAIES
jgi:hypothetical protein